MIYITVQNQRNRSLINTQREQMNHGLNQRYNRFIVYVHDTNISLNIVTIFKKYILYTQYNPVTTMTGYYDSTAYFDRFQKFRPNPLCFIVKKTPDISITSSTINSIFRYLFPFPIIRFALIFRLLKPI